MRIRKNIQQLTASEVAALRRAFSAAYIATGDGYEAFAGIHGFPDPISCPHHSADFAFLPWHREYILQFEDMLRRFEPDVVLPYWDWTEDPSPTPDGLPALLQPEALGNPLHSAPMGWVRGLVTQIAGEWGENGDFVRLWIGNGQTARAVDPPESRHDPQWHNMRALVDTALDSPSFEALTDALEQPHDALHGYIGHHMGSVPTAAFDPLFWLHHCNVDRQWATWQLSHPQQDRMPFPDATANDLGPRRFGELLKVPELGYDYDDLAPRRGLPPAPIPEAPSSHPRLVLAGMKQPNNESVSMRFFTSAQADETTPTIGNPDFLGQISLFGSIPMPGMGGDHGHHGHHGANTRPFSRHLLVDGPVDPSQVIIVTVDAMGKRLPTRNFAPNAPRFVEH